MHFSVSAIQDEGMPDAMNEARNWLEGWLNQTLQDADFGCRTTSIMLLVFCTSSLPRAPAVSRLSTDAAGRSTLALHITIDPELVQRTEPASQLSLLCAQVVRGLPVRPLRKPKGLEYERLYQALLACIQPLAQSAA
jgi:hypothetical protein